MLSTTIYVIVEDFEPHVKLVDSREVPTYSRTNMTHTVLRVVITPAQAPR